jgi:hypothetical protein
VQLAVVAALIFVTVSLLLLPRIGSYAAPIGQIAGFAVAAAVMLALARRNGGAEMIDGATLAGLVGVAGACLLVGPIVGPHLGGWRVVLDGAVLILYPLLLVVLRIVPRRHVAASLDLLRDSLGGKRRRSRHELEAAVDAIDGDRRRILSLLAFRRYGADEAARELHEAEQEVLARGVEALRELTNLPPSDKVHDARIGHYLFHRGSRVDRVLEGRRLTKEGADPAELHYLDKTLCELRKIRALSAADPAQVPEPDPESPSVSPPAAQL